MALQLTPEQERRIQAVVNAGAYRSTEEALNAALAVVELWPSPTSKELRMNWRLFFSVA
jgi:Arc/MetJ-type ribon-helix-helix transcriptional regulator